MGLRRPAAGACAPCLCAAELAFSHPPSAGCSLPCRAEVSLERAFEPGMAYVALRCAHVAGRGSRVRPACCTRHLPPPRWDGGGRAPEDVNRGRPVAFQTCLHSWRGLHPTAMCKCKAFLVQGRGVKRGKPAPPPPPLPVPQPCAFAGGVAHHWKHRGAGAACRQAAAQGLGCAAGMAGVLRAHGSRAFLKCCGHPTRRFPAAHLPAPCTSTRRSSAWHAPLVWPSAQCRGAPTLCNSPVVSLHRSLGPPADPKVVLFYTRLRQRQLAALGLDPAQFRTLY